MLLTARKKNNLIRKKKKVKVTGISQPQEGKDEEVVISLYTLIVPQAVLRVLENFLYGRLG